MGEHFQIPTTRLQKAIIIRGKTTIDSIPEYVGIRMHYNDTKHKKHPCHVPTSSNLDVAEAIKGALFAKKSLLAVTNVDKARQQLLMDCIHELNTKKGQIHDEVEKIEKNYMQNLKFRENDKLETLSKIDNYANTTKEIKKEKEKQDILLRIGLIMESLLEELAPNEDLLGHLSLQENAFKSKADTLAIKKNILMVRMKKLNAQLKKNLFQCEELKKQLFKKNFLLSENSHYKMNLINSMTEVDIKSMRAVLELEYKLATLRLRAYQVKAERAWLYWFLDWVLFDVLGSEMLTGITSSSTPEEKIQSIIECYKNTKTILAKRARLNGPTAVDIMFH